MGANQLKQMAEESFACGDDRRMRVGAGGAQYERGQAEPRGKRVASKRPTRPPSREGKFQLPPAALSAEEFRRANGVTNRGRKSPSLAAAQEKPVRREKQLSAVEMYFTLGSPSLAGKQEEGSQDEGSDSESQQRAADSDSDYSECSDMLSPMSPAAEEVRVGVHDVEWGEVGEDSSSIFSFVRSQNTAPSPSQKPSSLLPTLGTLEVW